MCVCVLFFPSFCLCLYSSFLLPRSPRFASRFPLLYYSLFLFKCVFASVDFCFLASLLSPCVLVAFLGCVFILLLSLCCCSASLLLYCECGCCCYFTSAASYMFVFVRLHFFLDSLIYRRLSTLKFLTCFVFSSFLLIDFACFVFFFKFIMFQSIVFSKYFVLD